MYICTGVWDKGKQVTKTFNTYRNDGVKYIMFTGQDFQITCSNSNNRTGYKTLHLDFN